jgi:hypothetical protein
LLNKEIYEAMSNRNHEEDEVEKNRHWAEMIEMFFKGYQILLTNE